MGHFFVRGLKILRKGCHDVSLLFIGDGSYRKELENEVKKLRLEDYVKFIGIIPQSDLVKYYYITDACLSHLPDIYYGNMVVAQKDYKARLFNKKENEFEEIKAITTFGQFNSVNNSANEPELDRNYRAFGKQGQAIISKLKVVVVGCGGLGWIIAQQLGLDAARASDATESALTHKSEWSQASKSTFGIDKVPARW